MSMPRYTKEELSEDLNNHLGLDVDFTKMLKDDLLTLHECLLEEEEEPVVAAELFSSPLKNILNKKLSDKPVGDLTLMELVQNLFPALKKKGGIFGFGLIPSLRRKKQKSK